MTEIERSNKVYDSTFYQNHICGSRSSAAIVVPLVIDLIHPKTVIDVGCGVGTWLCEFLKAGASGIGVDGEYVGPDQLQIPCSAFLAADIFQPLAVPGQFDLAVCLEVAEHLPPSRADSFVADLVRLAPYVLFSAALPGQGGTNHINEQFLEYWKERFARHGYRAIDAIRPLVFDNPDVEWWYQQNIVLMVSENCPLPGPVAHTSIHPILFTENDRRLRNPTLRQALRQIPGAVMREFHRVWHQGRSR